MTIGTTPTYFFKSFIRKFYIFENSYILTKKPIRLAILGDMLELGEDSINQHAKIADLMAFKKIEKICCVGYYMKYLYNKLLFSSELDIIRIP